jgi:hypothetical protein
MLSHDMRGQGWENSPLVVDLVALARSRVYTMSQ